MKILIAYDGSEAAQRMLRELVDRLAWFGERPHLTLLHVHVTLPSVAAWAGREAVETYYQQESESLLATGAAILDGAGVAYVAQRGVGEPAAEITRIAERGHYDLIVMGKHGAGAFATMVLGSVTMKVLARSSLPVLMLGQP